MRFASVDHWIGVATASGWAPAISHHPDERRPWLLVWRRRTPQVLAEIVVWATTIEEGLKTFESRSGRLSLLAPRRGAG